MTDRDRDEIVTDIGWKFVFAVLGLLLAFKLF